MNNFETMDRIAKMAHEVNRAYCQSIGDNSQLPWEDAQNGSACQRAWASICTAWAASAPRRRTLAG